MEDHIGRNTGLFGQLAAQGPEGIEQRIANRIDRAAAISPPPRFGPALAFGGQRDQHARFAREDRLCIAAQREAAMLGRDQTAAGLKRACQRTQQMCLLGCDDPENA